MNDVCAVILWYTPGPLARTPPSTDFSGGATPPDLHTPTKRMDNYIVLMYII